MILNPHRRVRVVSTCCCNELVRRRVQFDSSKRHGWTLIWLMVVGGVLVRHGLRPQSCLKSWV